MVTPSGCAPAGVFLAPALPGVIAHIESMLPLELSIETLFPEMVPALVLLMFAPLDRT
jgi:hypothetical protein